ncbi:MAG: prolyl oligopeptidase family serine peptidase [Ilumatobacteraceae bacterium]
MAPSPRHPVDSDQLVVQEDDDRFFLTVEMSRNEAAVLFHSESKLTTECWWIPASEPTASPATLLGRTEGHEYSAEHWGDRWVFLSNRDAEDFQVLTAPIDRPSATEVLDAHVAGRRILSAEPFAGHLVLHEWADARQRLRVRFRDGSESVVELGETPAEVEFGDNPEYDSETLRFSYQALNLPHTVYEQHVATNERRMLKQTPVLGVDLARYRSTRTWAVADDGTRIPVDLVHRDDTALDGSAPVLLYGYGAYETSVPPYFSVARLSLLDRGWVFALAHPRGGGELGRRWYLDGKLLAKRNTFTDFTACIRHLVEEGVGARDRIAIRGASAGGLLVGAAMDLDPDAVAAVIAGVPFVDVVSTMSDPSLPLTITEWEEWGDPRTEPYASYMASYSPYDNVASRAYPAMYVTAGLNDPRVSYHEPAKWVAKIRAMRTNAAPILLKTEMGAGHGGPSGRYDAWRDEAMTLAFLLDVV